MTVFGNRRSKRRVPVLTIVFAAFAAACASSASHAGGTGATAGSVPDATRGGRVATIDHVTPAVDFIGGAPSRFVWTAMAGADSYSIGVWNEVDQIIWRQDHIPGTSVDRPDDVPLDPGTYLWSVSALRDGQLIAESGLAHFVVKNP
jgi:hypothetical protein